MRVHTFNSIYEVDAEHLLIRRIDGNNKPTPRFSADGEWRTYVSISEPTPGAPMVITWPDGQPELRDHTVTSNVLGVEPWLYPEPGISSTSDFAL